MNQKTKSQKATRSQRRVWLLITGSEEGFGVTIGPDLRTAWRHYCRRSIRAVLLALLLTMAGCDGAARIKKVFCGVLHSLFANNSGMQDQQNQAVKEVKSHEDQEAGHNRRL